MAATTQLMLRIRSADGQYRYQHPALNGQGKPKPLYAMVHGKPEHHPEGVYYLRYTEKGTRRRDNVGTDVALAVTRQMQREFVLRGAALGVELAAPSKTVPVVAPVVESAPRTLWAPLERTYILEVEGRKSRRTADAYRRVLELFSELCPATYIEDVDRTHMLLFESKLRARGNSSRTIYNRLRQLGTFLKYAGRGPVLKRKDMPTYTKKVAVAYSTEEIKQLFAAAASPEQLLLFEFFLYTGFREQEVMYMGVNDIDFQGGLVHVREKRDMGWQPKDREERSVPIPDRLVHKLKAYIARHPKQRLLFPTAKGKPNGHFLRQLKRLALSAGLNCGHCRAKTRLCCDKHPVCSRIQLHKFRRTFAYMHHEAGVSPRTLMDWLGHSDLETTLRYLAISNKRSEATRRAVNSSFASLDVGPVLVPAAVA